MKIKEMEDLTEHLKLVFIDVFMTKEDGKALELRLDTKLDKIQNSLDLFARQNNINTGEIKILNKRMKSAEDWIDQASPKIGVIFES